MKATEAAEHSDVIGRKNEPPYYKIDGQWYCRADKIYNINLYAHNDYVPLVPKKIYKVGDKVTFLEALNSGMCFTVGGYKHVWIWKDENLFYYVGDIWVPNHWGISTFKKAVCTLCEDPSIQPKPTLESLPAWTRCKVRPVNEPNEGPFEVIKHPFGHMFHYESGSDCKFCRVDLISIYNPKTEQWEDV